MDLDLARRLACPACRRHFAVEVFEASAGYLRRGGLRCQGCATVVPVCAGFPLFPETARPDRTWGVRELEQVESTRFGDAAPYAAFVEQKYRRPARDTYAAFLPFNESTRAFFPFVSLLRSRLRPGELILDLWCRTGWTGELLASLFPEQRVLSVWEGNSDVLGYRGFRHWLGDSERRRNLDILFHSPNEPLPLADASVALVHGLDTLHRYRQDVLVPEVLRVLRPDGAAVFPHVHLTNAEPDPYFDRGCLQRHGCEYREELGQMLAGSDRRAFVFSELDLFERSDMRVEDDAETTHYNGLIAILPETLAGAALDGSAAAVRGGPTSPDARVVANPMWNIDLHLGSATVEPSKLDGAVGRMLARHPLYARHLAKLAPMTLAERECELLYWAERSLTLAEIAARTQQSLEDMVTLAESLAARDLVDVRPVSRAMAALQTFYGEQAAVAPEDEQTPAALWRKATDAFAARPLVIVDGEGSVFTYGDAAEIVARAATALLREGVQPGDVVALCSPFGAEALFVTWACLLAGVVLAPLDWSTPEARTAATLASLEAKLLFCDAARFPLLGRAARCVVFDDERVALPDDAISFSDWIDVDADQDALTRRMPASTSAAVLLQTSGTSGQRKFVELSHGAMYRSGRNLVRAFEWREDDVLVSTGELHAMSGLRNPCLATLFAGASVVVVGAAERRNPMALAEAVQRHRATLLSTVPGTLRLLTQYEGRIPAGGLESLRMVLSTGAPLPPTLADAFRARFGLPVLEVYGLTEMAGCQILLTHADLATAPRGSIGRPRGCIAQIVGDDGQVLPAGEVGELRVYSENLMRGYRGESASGTKVSRGWCFTGDLAVRDHQGFVTLLARRRDIIKDARGDLIYPAEVESILMTHADVRDAGVCGYRTEDGLEKIAAFVVLRQPVADETAFVEQLRRLVLDQIGPYRVPTRVEILAELPRLQDGSLLRHELVKRCG